MANPESVVVSYQGDGDLASIGLAEIISAAQLGKIDEARRGLAEVRRLQPTVSIDWAQKHSPWVREQDRDRYVEAFRLAGLN